MRFAVMPEREAARRRPPFRFPAAAAVAFALAASAACRAPREQPAGRSKEAISVTSPSSIEDALKAATPSLLAIPGVIGTGLGERSGRPAILVLVRARTAVIDARVPRELGGHPVEVREVGEVRALGDSAP